MRLKDFLSSDIISESTKKEKIHLNIKYSSSLHIDDEMCTDLTKILEKEFPEDNISLDFYSGRLTVLFSNINDNNFQHIMEYEKDLNTYIKNFSKENMVVLVPDFSRLYCEGFPTRKIEYPTITLELTEPTSLSGLDKFIFASQSFEIVNAEKVTDSALSVMKIKCPNVYIAVVKNASGGWRNIIQEFIDAKSDILECQEELIGAGFKEYAKL
jgi:hypothetical protein